jgi:peptidoglycan/LPS O-acetylase OafA/YrhL
VSGNLGWPDNCLKPVIEDGHLKGLRAGKMSKLNGFRPDIEGLRGLAILVVVAFHCGAPGFDGGFVGVDVFFVLSGYLITGLLVTEIDRTSRLNLMNFYARRLRRLLPASALVLLVTLLASCVLMAPNELEFAGRASRATALYMSNVFFASNTLDYFAPNAETNPLLHTWTLAVEEQFYFVWPLLIMLGLQFWRSRRALVGILSCLLLVSLASSVWFTTHAGVFAFYSLPTRAWEFGIGGLAALVPRTWLTPTKAWIGVGWAGAAAILYSVHSISNPVNFPGWIALLPVVGTTAALVAAAALPGRGVHVFLESRPMQALGKLSYSWYLWHWPSLIFAEIFYPNCSVGGKLLACGIALGLAALAHRYVENPIRFNPYLTKRPALSICMGFAITIFSLTAATLSLRFASHLADSPEIRAIASRVSDIADMSRDQCLSPEISSELKTCVFGNASSPNNLVLFGDSHARQWFNPLRSIAETRGWKLTTMVKATCPATDISPPELTGDLVNNCRVWRASAMRSIVSMRPSVVFVANASYYLGRNGKTTGRSISVETWREGTRRTLETLAGAGLTVVSVRDNPLPPFDVPLCLQRAARHPWYPVRCDVEKSLALNPAIFDAEKAAASGLPRIHFLDFTDYFCTGETCPVVQGTTVMYRDDNHLTGKFASSLMPVIAAQLDPILMTYTR